MTDGELWVICGVTRSGKTVKAKTLLSRHTCRFVWDPDGQHGPDVARSLVTSRAQCLGAIRAGARQIVYRGPLADFDWWCRCAFAWGRQLSLSGERLGILAEETADVTSPGKAPEHWGILVRRALKYGISIYAITQRPAESDKTAFGNATWIHCCKLVRRQDVRYMAGEMGCDPDRLAALVMDPAHPVKGRAPGVYDYLQYHPGTGQLTRGRLTFTKAGQPRFDALALSVNPPTTR